METKLERSSSYVFKTSDGAYLSFTRLTGGRPARSVCLISEDENATLCIDWDTGKLTIGNRSDAATPWRFRKLDSLSAYQAEQPNALDKLLGFVQGLVTASGGTKQRKTGFYKIDNGKVVWY